MNLFCHKKASARSRGFGIGLMMLMLIGGQFLIGQPGQAETQQHRWAGDVPIMQGWQIEPELGFEIGRAHVRTPVTSQSRMPSSA